MRNNRKYQITKHHIIPISRNGPDTYDNIARVCRRDHELYHALFENRTPDEIVEYLNNKFWARKYDVTIRRVAKRSLEL